MRYKPEHKEETHRRIVETASREFRSHGFEGVGIAKLMGELHLTHGGFYAHFADKEELVAESCALVLDQMLQRLLAALETGGIAAILDFYLSEDHRDHPADGCLLPTLAAEVARHSPASREAFTRKLSELFDALAERMPGQTLKHKRTNVYVMFAAMAGAVSLARAVSDASLSKNILDSTHEHLLRLFKEEAD